MRDMKLIKNAFHKCQTEGVVPVLRSARRHIPHIIHKKCCASRVFRGESQFVLYTNLRSRYHRIIYDAPASPWKRIRVNPNLVEYKANPAEDVWGLGRIRGGEWDTPEYMEPVEEYNVVKGLRQRFKEGRDWEETAYVDTAKRKLKAGEDRWNYRNIDEFLDIRCKYVDDLYESIKNHGYRPNVEGGHEVPDIDMRNHQDKYSHQLEPLVAIGRDGNIHWSDGFHRFAIARILDIDSLPVNVLARHDQWQQRRDTLATADSLERVDSTSHGNGAHPDLSDVLQGFDEQ